MGVNLSIKNWQVRYEDVLIKDDDVAKGIIEFISRSAVEKMVLGLSSRSSFARFLLLPSSLPFSLDPSLSNSPAELLQKVQGCT